jgi:hypothetical protein
MAKAETIVDSNSLRALNITLRKCLLLNLNEEPIEQIN